MTQPPDGYRQDPPYPSGQQGPQPGPPYAAGQYGPESGAPQPGYAPGFGSPQAQGYGAPAPAAPSGAGKRWQLPVLLGALALVLGLGIGTGVGIASTSDERSALKGQKRDLTAQDAVLTGQLNTVKEELTTANNSHGACRRSTQALQALTEIANAYLAANDEYYNAEFESKEEEAALAKTSDLYNQFQRQKGVAKADAEACVVPGTKS